jgi:hypothetical protein
VDYVAEKGALENRTIGWALIQKVVAHAKGLERRAVLVSQEGKLRDYEN